MKTGIFNQLLCCVLVIAPTAAISREPPPEIPLTDDLRQSVARDLVNQSDVIVDGVIAWSDRGRRSFHSSNKNSLKSVPISEMFPKIRPTKILKGPALSEYLLTPSEDGPIGIVDVPSGTPVRLLLSAIRTKRGTFWEVRDTSWTSGRLADERAINAEIDRVLGSKRPSDIVFTEEPPPLDEP